LSIELRCIGAAQTVTGSRHVLRTSHTTLLLDCGLFQGHRRESLERNRQLGFSASDIDAVVLSHAHIDHSGALPMLCKQGYRGPIYTTPATRDLCAVMLLDAANIQASDARYLNRAIERDHLDADPVEPLFDQDDVALVMGQITGVPYHRKFQVSRDISVTYLDAGHVLGSAIVVVDVDDEGESSASCSPAISAAAGCRSCATAICPRAQTS
jgi:metallo-beta-lactamase family protein